MTFPAICSQHHFDILASKVVVTNRQDQTTGDEELDAILGTAAKVRCYHALLNPQLNDERRLNAEIFEHVERAVSLQRQSNEWAARDYLQAWRLPHTLFCVSCFAPHFAGKNAIDHAVACLLVLMLRSLACTDQIRHHGRLLQVRIKSPNGGL